MWILLTTAKTLLFLTLIFLQTHQLPINPENSNNFYELQTHNYDKQIIYDYVIMGAGLSGLHAAQQLLKKNKTVIILEALDRVGGKISTLNLKEIPQLQQKQWFNQIVDKSSEQYVIDLGAAEVDDDNYKVMNLSKHYGLQLELLNREGTQFFLSQNKSITMNNFSQKYYDKLYPFFQRYNERLSQFEKKFAILMNQFNQESYQLLRRYQSSGIKSFIINELNLKEKQLQQLVFNQLQLMFCLEITDKVLVHDLMISGKDLNNLRESLNIVKRTKTLHIKGGNGLLIQKLADEVYGNGGLIKKKHQVVKIDNSNYEKQIIVHAKINHQNSSQHVKVKARNAMYGLPLWSGKSIEISKLSYTRRIAFDSFEVSEMMKSFVITKKPLKSIVPLRNIHFNGKSLASLVMNISPLDNQIGIYVFFHPKRVIKQWRSLSSQQKKEFLINSLMKGYQLDDQENRQILQDSVQTESNLGDSKFLRNAYSIMCNNMYYSKVLQSGETLSKVYSEDMGISFITSELGSEQDGYMEGAIINANKSIFKTIKKEHLKIIKKSQHMVEQKRNFKKY